MRRIAGLVGVLALIGAACGEGAEPEIPEQPTPSTTTTSVEASTSPILPETTTTPTAPASGEWTVGRYGTNPRVVMGERGELGSGCSPGTELLPDGIWFGWIEETGAESVSFDLACLWPGRLEPAASNDAERIRDLRLSSDAAWYGSGRDEGPTPAVNAPGLPETLPHWIFINDGLVTELAEYPEPVVWASSELAWPGLVPGCCDGGDVAPPSPADSLPDVGWPADGLYKAWVAADAQSWIELDVINISKWFSCKDNPGLCPEWWVGDEVYADLEGEYLIRSVALSPELTVVIMPILGEAALIGDGVAFGELITDMNESVNAWVDLGADLVALSENPVFPFGQIPWPGESEGGELGYRGPGGAHLTWFGGWLALEIHNGQPILYIHAGLIAG